LFVDAAVDTPGIFSDFVLDLRTIIVSANQIRALVLFGTAFLSLTKKVVLDQNEFSDPRFSELLEILINTTLALSSIQIS
jgi:hypothetical protein